MEKKRFISFDAETFLMIEDVTGTEPEVTEKENYFELKMYAPDKEEKTAIAGLLKQINADASGKPQNDIPEEVKEVAGKLAKAFGARVEIHRIEIPEKKRKFRKKPRKAMKPVEFPGVNVVFAKDQPEYMPLPAMKIPNDPQGLIITKWQLSPEELERVKETGTIHLSMLTFNQPLQPVLLTVDLPTEK